MEVKFLLLFKGVCAAGLFAGVQGSEEAVPVCREPGLSEGISTPALAVAPAVRTDTVVLSGT